MENNYPAAALSDDGYASYEEQEDRTGQPSTSKVHFVSHCTTLKQNRLTALRLLICCLMQGGLHEQNMPGVAGVTLLLNSVRLWSAKAVCSLDRQCNSYF